ncbi:hypothetical protein KEM56_000023 [Ascosphaera pollenicola]|nr:hypothetical protein KEM56_000023 [Ascosphaera pollenicola]
MHSPKQTAVLAKFNARSSPSQRLATGLHFNVPQTAPADANTIASSAPIGISIEFFEFPNYVQNLPLTDACLNKLGEAMNARPPMRIGGTSQDSAVYNASLPSAISYRWPDSTHKGVPLDLQFGKEYIALASKYDGPVTFGLNRRMNNLSNTIEAARLARSGLSTNFHAFENGNEPNFYKDSDPIAEGQLWTASADFSSKTHWQSAIGAALNETEPFVQAGVYYGTGPFNTSSLAEKEQAAGTLDDVKTFCHHFYSQGGDSPRGEMSC